MYTAFFGLQKYPFSATPDPSVLYLTPNHREALAGLSYAILMHKGFAVLTGDAGTGKTTLLSRVVQMIPRSTAAMSIVVNSALTPSEFLEAVMIDFGMEDIPDSKARRLQRFQQFLTDAYRAGRTSVLIIDEAQKLTDAVLEEIRLLSNCELPEQKLLQIILSGQNELEEQMERQALRQLKQRISVRLRIAPLKPNEVSEYIRFRWVKAGGATPLPFEASALAAIAAYSKGIPRVINILCDDTLVIAFSENARSVSAAHVLEAANDLALTRDSDASAKTPAFTPATAPLMDTPAAQPAYAACAIPEPLPTLRRYGSARQPRKSVVSRLVSKLSWVRHANGNV